MLILIFILVLFNFIFNILQICMYKEQILGFLLKLRFLKFSKKGRVYRI